MGQKYMIYGYDYVKPKNLKQTQWIIIAFIYLIVWSIKYDSVDLYKRR